MHITRLVLEGYRHLKLKRIKRFDYTPKKRIQHIVGTNGSGKSSIIRQLSPLPGSPDDFYCPGKKEIWITHQGKSYYLASIFGEDRNTYIFEVDGVVLNRSLLVSSYRELVQSHFGYNEDIHQLMIGKKTFHGMSVADRRSLFMKMNDEDFTFALKLYKSIKERIKEKTILLKQLQHRLGGELEKLIPPEKIQEETELLNKEKTILSELMQNLRSNSNQVTESDLLKTQTDQHFLQQFLSKNLDKIKQSLPVQPLHILQNKHQQLRQSINNLTAIYHAKNEAIMKMEELQAKLTEVLLIDKEALQEELRKLDTEINECLTRRVFQLNESKIAQIEQEIYRINASLHSYCDLQRDVLQSLPHDQLTRASAMAESEKYKLAEAELSHLEALEKDCIEKIRKLKASLNTDPVDCPKCHYQWRLNYSETEQRVQESRLADISARQNELKKAKLASSIRQSAYEKYWSVVDYLNSLFKLEAVSDIVAQIDRESPFLTNPSEFYGKFAFLLGDIEVTKNLIRLRQKKQNKEELFAKISQSSTVNYGKVKEDLEIEKAQLADVQKTLTPLVEEERELKQLISLISEIQEIYAKLTDTRASFNADKAAFFESMLSGIENKVINHLQGMIYRREGSLSLATFQQNFIDSINESIQLTTRLIDLLKESCKALSPTEGLIAKGMSSFINSFVATANSLIGQVWEYPMHIVPITFNSDDDVDLDYRFAVRIGEDDDSPTKDISECSSGMKEIVNLALLFTARNHLGLESFPVFLDEFAVNMDDTHRSSVFSMISHLSDLSGVAQTFVVSHHAQSYASLSNADVVVLCDANISLPGHVSYNTCVDIT